MRPVDADRVITEEPETCIVTGLGEFAYQVATGQGLVRFVRRLVSIEETEPVVMFRCERHVRHPCVLRELDDRLGVEPVGNEVLLQDRVFLGRYPLVVLDPLVIRQQGVQAVMQEQAVLRVLKLFEGGLSRVCLVDGLVVGQVPWGVAHGTAADSNSIVVPTVLQGFASHRSTVSAGR
jgi:hypothetical protein